MGKYYCDYCDVFLTHDSQAVRKDHNSGRNHVQNVIDYYSSLGHNQAQSIIDQITRQYESGPGRGPPMGMGGGGMNGGFGSGPVMRSAGGFQGGGGGGGNFRPPPQNGFRPPGQGGFPAPGNNFNQNNRPPPSFMPQGGQMGMGGGYGGPPQQQAPTFSPAPPGGANGVAPMINPDRLRMLGRG